MIHDDTFIRVDLSSVPRKPTLPEAQKSNLFKIHVIAGWRLLRPLSIALFPRGGHVSNLVEQSHAKHQKALRPGVETLNLKSQQCSRAGVQGPPLGTAPRHMPRHFPVDSAWVLNGIPESSAQRAVNLASPHVGEDAYLFLSPGCTPANTPIVKIDRHPPGTTWRCPKRDRWGHAFGSVKEREGAKFLIMFLAPPWDCMHGSTVLGPKLPTGWRRVNSTVLNHARPQYYWANCVTVMTYLGLTRRPRIPRTDVPPSSSRVPIQPSAEGGRNMTGLANHAHMSKIAVLLQTLLQNESDAGDAFSNLPSSNGVTRGYLGS
ncbi:hypothetical protein FB451DRAFT_1164001 [Mycena latifolia]|nr:hypothetical protein FB451DRAFT_1164001 [Mycena latifolia]